MRKVVAALKPKPADRWDKLLRKLAACDTDDPKGWVEVTDHSPEFFKKSLGV